MTPAGFCLLLFLIVLARAKGAPRPCAQTPAPPTQRLLSFPSMAFFYNRTQSNPPKTPLALQNRRFTPSNPNGRISKRTHFRPSPGTRFPRYTPPFFS